MNLSKRICVALVSFYLAGVVAIAIMRFSKDGLMAVLGAPFWAACGLLVGPEFFAAGTCLVCCCGGHRIPPNMEVALTVLACVSYVALFVGVCSKHKIVRVSCLAIEAVCAFVAAKVFAYFP